ncbi:uncharacterized protein ACBT44_005111 [Syngnathus typhle]
MGDSVTPPPLESTTKTVSDLDVDGSIIRALIGGVIGATLIFICVIALLLWFRSREKGSYITHEMDNQDDEMGNLDEDDCDHGDNDDDNDFICSDAEPQHKELFEISEEA